MLCFEFDKQKRKNLIINLKQKVSWTLKVSQENVHGLILTFDIVGQISESEMYLDQKKKISPSPFLEQKKGPPPLKSSCHTYQPFLQGLS